VTVRVVDAAGTALAGAHVRAWPLRAATPEDAAAVAARTDSDGKAVLEVVDATQDQHLEVSPLAIPNAGIAEGKALGVPLLTPRFEPVTLSPWRPHDDEVRVKANARVVLRAVDAREGKPVPGAEFHVALGEGTSTSVGCADAAGVCEIWLGKDERLRVQATGFGSAVAWQPTAWREVGSETGDVTMRLDDRPQRIRLHVTGRSADSQLRWEASTGSMAREEGSTGRAGVGSHVGSEQTSSDLEIPGLLPDGTYEVRLWEFDGEDHGWAHVRGLRPSERVVDVAMTRGVEVRGRLAGAGDPRGVEVEAKPAVRGGPLDALSTPVDADGRFVLRLAPGTWNLGATVRVGTRWVRARREVVVGETPVEVELLVE
jgi:hypothetical protein